jgi:hypothetical protein
VVIIVVNSWTGNPVGYLSEEIGNNILVFLGVMFGVQGATFFYQH